MAKSPEAMKAAMIAGMAGKTGKSLEEWLAIVRASKLSKHKEFMTLLKEKHGLTHGFANMIALQALQSDSHTAGDTGALVDAQYAGAKAALRPLYKVSERMSRYRLRRPMSACVETSSLPFFSLLRRPASMWESI
jgi:hypothetical protein